jgi:hypothetical protein
MSKAPIYFHAQLGFVHPPRSGIRHYQISVRPATGVACVPPIVAGQVDSFWMRTANRLPKPTDKAGAEKLWGGKLLPLEGVES